MIELPIDAFVPSIEDALRRSRAVVVVAQPGAGKTTRVPPALVGDGKVILLQPRRVAARAVVRRIADERRWTIGREVGWQMRFDRRFGPDTRLIVATEGILTARLQSDPLLADFSTVVLDEFHERSLHADVAFALARQAWLARDDLRIVVMSATIDAAEVAAYLHECPIVTVPGNLHPIDVRYAPGRSIAEVAIELLPQSGGDLLAFLPGASEIRQAIAEIGSRAKGATVEVLPLHGSLGSDEQDAALRPSPVGRRRIVVATNVAETSITVPGVTAVVDSGLHKVARYDSDRAIDSLEVERITADSADQRAGRAGRTAPGIAVRLWDARDRLRPHREAEIRRVDLSGAVLDVLAWAGDPRSLEWFEAPQPDRIDAALELLGRLGAVEHGALTIIGRRLQKLPLHPRLGRVLIAGGGARPLVRACAILSERHYVPRRHMATSSDLLSAIDEWREVPPHVERAARSIEQMMLMLTDRPLSTSIDEIDFRRAILAGYPDRVAARREAGSPRVKLATGAGAVITEESGVKSGDFIVALDVQASTRPNRVDSRVRMASRIEREWLQPTSTELIHRFDAEGGTVRAARIERYDQLILTETPAPADPDVAASLLADAWLARGLDEAEEQIVRRLRFSGRAVDLGDAARRAASGARSLAELRLSRGLGADLIRILDREAPATLALPSGRTARLDYRDDGSVVASVKLQELFGLGDTPRIGRRGEPVLFALLAPNGRPVQLTRDLRSFWERTYPEVRKELRGRYPKHPWPEDPWTAPPSARPVRKRRARS